MAKIPREGLMGRGAERMASVDDLIEQFHAGKKFYRKGFEGNWEPIKDIQKNEQPGRGHEGTVLVRTASNEDENYYLERLSSFLEAQKEAEVGGVEAYFASGRNMRAAMEAAREEQRGEDRSPSPENIRHLVETSYLDQIAKDAMKEIQLGPDNYLPSTGLRDIESMASSGPSMEFAKYFPGWEQMDFIQLHQAIEAKKQEFMQEMKQVIAEQEGVTPEELHKKVEEGRKAEARMRSIAAKLQSAYRPE